MKFTFLSREQEKKKVFLQLGGHFHLPIEIIYYLYQTNKTMEKEELQNHIDDYKSTYAVNITMNRCLGRILKGTDKHASEEDVINIISGGTSVAYPAAYCCHQLRRAVCWWCSAGELIEEQIKQCKKLCGINVADIGWVDLIDNYTEYQEIPFQINRDALLRQIEIIGNSSFLLKERVCEEGPYQGEYYCEPLTYQEKISFMKKQGIELLNLYEDYLNGIDAEYYGMSPFNIIVMDDNNWRRTIWEDDIYQ